jgi:phosphatidylserine/phosphatidylglycerophosphate/cardiolipin synthase-like enzyme
VNRQLLEKIYQVAQELPPLVLNSVIHSLGEQVFDSHYPFIDQILNQLSNPMFRRLVGELFTLWQQNQSDWDSRAIASALMASAYSIQTTQQSLAAELVWTGPPTLGIPVRRTDQVLLQLIRDTQQQLIIISFAVYKIPEIAEALLEALERGIQLKIILETTQAEGGKMSFKGTTALGQKILRDAQVFLWPVEKRLHDPQGRYGSLHIKSVISDQKYLFITSANLTEYALTLNMEMGVLLKSPALASQVTDLIYHLIHQEVLVKL